MSCLYNNTIQIKWYDTLYNRKYEIIQYKAIRYNTIQYNTLQYNTMQCNAMQYNIINTKQYNKI